MDRIEERADKSNFGGVMDKRQTTDCKESKLKLTYIKDEPFSYVLTEFFKSKVDLDNFIATNKLLCVLNIEECCNVE